MRLLIRLIGRVGLCLFHNPASVFRLVPFEVGVLNGLRPALLILLVILFISSFRVVLGPHMATFSRRIGVKMAGYAMYIGIFFLAYCMAIIPIILAGRLVFWWVRIWCILAGFWYLAYFSICWSGFRVGCPFFIMGLYLVVRYMSRRNFPFVRL